jgi:hypothetical protein
VLAVAGARVRNYLKVFITLAATGFQLKQKTLEKNNAFQFLSGGTLRSLVPLVRSCRTFSCTAINVLSTPADVDAGWWHSHWQCCGSASRSLAGSKIIFMLESGYGSVINFQINSRIRILIRILILILIRIRLWVQTDSRLVNSSCYIRECSETNRNLINKPDPDLKLMFKPIQDPDRCVWDNF